MDILEQIKNRRSVRTFDGRPLTQAHLDQLNDFISTISNPYDIPVEFMLLDKDVYGLSSPVISGERMYAAAKVKTCAHSEEAFGYAFEQLVLFAQSLGIGTTWLGGALKRSAFEEAVQLESGERMYCASPLGYPAKRMSVREITMRAAIKADKRKPLAELFFENDFSSPLHHCGKQLQAVLKAVWLAPSAVNKQPWRVVKCGDLFHFYVKHNKGYAGEKTGDMQKIDMGIALSHFMLMAGGTLHISDPGIPTESDMEYIATVAL